MVKAEIIFCKAKPPSTLNLLDIYLIHTTNPKFQREKKRELERDLNI